MTETVTEVPDGIDAAAIHRWLAARVEVTGELAFEMIHGGRSNLTYHVRDEAGGHWVLRRPPLHHVLASAHDVGREHRIMAALQDSAVPVPPLVGVEHGTEVNGAPFYVMDFVAGHVLRDAAAAEAQSAAMLKRAGESLVDTLVALHQVDVDAVGLGDLAKREGYIERQLRRWLGQYEKGAERELPAVPRIHAKLAARVPEQQKVAIVHGDYRQDNVIAADDGSVAAVLDWELCTLGDPMADVGTLKVYWADPDDESIPLLSAPTTVDGFISSDEAIARYAAATDLDTSQLDYYVGFAYWRLALILEGVLTRFAAGAYGDDADPAVKQFAGVIDTLLANAEAAVDGLD